MRTQGKITAWNAGEGYGYITPATGAKQVWVHVTGFVDRTRPPEVGQIVTFSMHIDDDGKPCAEEVSRPGDKMIDDRDAGKGSWSFTKVLLFVLVLAVAGYFAYQKYHQEPKETAVITVPDGTPPKVTQPN